VEFLQRELHSKIRYKIILPFLLLTLLVALAGSAVALRLAAGSQQERLTNEVAEVTRITNDSIVRQEQANIDFLQQIVFAQENPEAQAPAVQEALANNNADGLRRALDPYMKVGMRSTRARIDRIIAFNTNGRSLVDLERYPLDSTTTYTQNTSLQLPTDPTSFVGRVLQGNVDEQGDKYAGILQLPSSIDGPTYYFATVAPVYLNNEPTNPVVGGVIVAMRVNRLLEYLVENSQAQVIIIYDAGGNALFSTRTPEVPATDDDALPIGETPDGPGVVADDALNRFDIDETTLEQLQRGESDAEKSVMSIMGREYQFAFTPMRIRQVSIGYIAAGLSRDTLLGSLNDLQQPIMFLTGIFMIGIVGLGAYVARQITTPLEELVSTTQDVTAGNLRRRSNVQTRDEIGTLSQSFNTMTGYLFRLYSRVLAESSQRAAIVESIADGVVVCDPLGNIQVLNRTTRELLGLGPKDPIPARFSDLPLMPLPEGTTAFGPEQTPNLQMLGERIVRVSDARVMSADGTYLGDVYVLQDLTAEVQMDQAKTAFINTISHELKTPVTTLRGTTELLMRGMFGPVEERQAAELDIMLQKLVGMTTLISNVIIIASIDSGSLTLELEPLELQETVEEAVWKLQKGIKEKGLTLTIDIPDDIPEVIADYDHFHTIMQQLVENARTYTDEGDITIRASRTGEFVQIDVCDTGRGIAPEMHEQIFERFVRGSGQGEGVDSQDRGIGLGLAIVQQLVQRLGGQVWVTSTVGQGSVFSFTLRHADDMGHPEKQDTAIGTAA
jgi:signal transduction histidine kinase/HAMP domain-containing protein